MIILKSPRIVELPTENHDGANFREFSVQCRVCMRQCWNGVQVIFLKSRLIKSPMSPQKEPYFSAKRAPCLRKRSLYLRQRALCFRMQVDFRKIWLEKSRMSPQKSPMSPQKGPMSPQKSPVYLLKSPMFPNGNRFSQMSARLLHWLYQFTTGSIYQFLIGSIYQFVISSIYYRLNLLYSVATISRLLKI